MAENDNTGNPPIPPGGGGPRLPFDGDGNKNLIPVNIEDEMRRSYLDYSMSVIVGRALTGHSGRTEARASPHSVRHG